MKSLEVKNLSSLSKENKKEIIYRKSLNLEEVISKTIQPLASRFKKDTFLALKEASEKWDVYPDPIILEHKELKTALDKVNKKDKTIIPAFEKAMSNIREFHEKQVPQNFESEIDDNLLGYKFQPFDNVALYVPGGKALYPSTVMMGVIPAKIAKVKNISVMSPPNKETGQVSNIVQAIAYLSGADFILQAGGAQAVMAMAYGVEKLNINPVDFIYGPGNIFVSAAKSHVFSESLCGIDSFAGPSEVLIIADKSANPNYLAHDLLAQAEHDENATAVLLCTDKKIAEEAKNILADVIIDRNINSKRKQITQEAISRNAHFLTTDTIDEAIDFSNQFAPEHLEIQTSQDDYVLSQIKAAGSIFVGEHAPVAIGDYYSGTNHILPTNRGARFSSGVSVQSFYRRITYQKVSKKGLERSKDAITIMSTVEDLFDEHGYSVLARFK